MDVLRTARARAQHRRGLFLLSLVKGGRDLQTHALEDWIERGYAALQVMENHLKTHDISQPGQLTVADIALYGYTHVADRCDYDLAAFRRSAPGCGGSSKPAVSSPWTGGRTQRSMTLAGLVAEA